MSEAGAQGAGEGSRLQALRVQLRAASKNRRMLEKKLYEVKQSEQAAVEELKTHNDQIAAYDEELKELRKETIKLQGQVFTMEVCKTSEQVRIEARIKAIEEHKIQFTDLYAKEKQMAEFRYKELQYKELEEKEKERIKKNENEKKYQNELEDVLAMEAECEQLEKECSILKKRNNAILLLLRKNLFDAETKRRRLINQEESHCSTSN